MRDFSLPAYLEVIAALRARNLPVYGVARWLAGQPARGAVIRHDVDRRPYHALRMAEAEAAAGVHTTYYFRVVGSAWDPEVIRAVHALGHEVGYHYEDLATCRGDFAKAAVAFERHLASIRQLALVTTAAMHGSPLSRHNNLDLWSRLDAQRLALAGEAFVSVNYAGTYYFTDTGRSWGAVATNLRDRPPGILLPAEPVETSRQLCTFIARPEVAKIALSAHPERWDTTLGGWLWQGAKDRVINLAKVAAACLR